MYPNAAARWVAGLLLLTATTALHAQTPAASGVPARYADAVAQSRAVVDSVMQAEHIPGVSVAVAVQGVPVWTEGFGMADLELRVPVSPDTRFRIGSISKVLTTAALARLYEEGRVDLDAPVQRYVPVFPEKRWPITTRQLAGHLAGIRHYRDDAEFLSNTRYPSVTSSLDLFRDDTLLFEPGTQFSYSTHAWTLVSAVIEAAAGMDYLRYMEQAVFTPLGLATVTPEYPDSLIPDRTGYYTLDTAGHVLNAPCVDNSWKWAGGGFLSNARDLVRFGAAHLGGRFLQPETVDLLFTNQQTTGGEPTPVGIGWFRTQGEALGGRVFVGHSGGSVGGTAMLVLIPEQQLVVAVLSNLDSARSSVMGLLVTRAFLDHGGF